MTDPFGLSATSDYFHDVGQMFVGYGLAGRDTVAGLYNVVAHPVNTVTGLYNVAAHPVQAYNAISQSVTSTWDSVYAGKGRIIGNVLIAAGTVASSATGATRLAGISETLANASTKTSYLQKLDITKSVRKQWPAPSLLIMQPLLILV